jgi:sterol desaturase/sphingolipid hydroxylase (fatty acid hydroxylase superfamily)
MSLMLMLGASMALTGAFMAALAAVARSPFGEAHRLRKAKGHGISREKFLPTAVFNSVLSVALVFGLAFALEDRLFHSGPVSAMRCLVEGVAILALYDFFYYLLHRYPLHEWRTLRWVHVVHHAAKNPTALDSLYLHPIENLLGLGLLWACAGAVRLAAGPVSTWSFGWVFLVYSLLNVLVHAGLDVKAGPLRLLSYLAERHTKHHVGMQGKNYASVTPIWDVIFGTEEP